MAILKYGSSGDEVKKLQEKLGFTGKDVDGIYGQKTQNAVLTYQKQNGLTQDGIAGDQTLSKLYGTGTGTSTGSSTGSTSTGSTSTTNNYKSGFNYADFSYGDFDPGASSAVTEAQALLQQQQQNKPGAYTPMWQDEADAYLNQYQNRDPFSYDFASDPVYQQYRNLYSTQGKLAMLDAMGQAAAMTGGYGNSYAQQVGQQTYNQYLGQLNQIVPELYAAAEERYARQGDDLMRMYELYMNRENQERANYDSELDRWYQEMARLQSAADTEYGRAYDAYLQDKEIAYNDYSTRRSEAYADYQAEQQRKYTKGGGDPAPRDTGKRTIDLDTQKKMKGELDDYLTKMPAIKAFETIESELLIDGYSPEIVEEWINSVISQTKIIGHGGYGNTTHKYVKQTR